MKVKDIVDGVVDESNLLLTHHSIDEAYKRSRLVAGDVLVTIRGTTGRVALVSSGLDGANITQDTARLRIKDGVDSRFVYFALQTRPLQRQIALHTIGQAVKGINIRDVRDLSLAVPDSLGEQRAIAEALSDVDALLAGLDRLIAKKRDLKQAAMQQLLTKKPNWITETLETIADVIDPHPSHRAPAEESNGMPFVGIGDLNEQGDLVGQRVRLVSPAVYEAHVLRYDVREALIGLGRVASIGKVVRLKPLGFRYAVSPTLGVIRATKVNREFLLYTLRSQVVGDQFKQIMSGSTRSSVGMNVLRRLRIVLPPTREEQTTIAGALTDMDAEVVALEGRRDKTRLLKQAMMQELLTGRIRLV